MTHLWLGRPGQEILQTGEASERRQQSADASYDRLMAPPCPACNQPVLDRDWERHKYEHGINEMVQPFGRPDAREAFFLAYSAAQLEEKLAIWRRRHPGIRLALAGDGTRPNGKSRLYWRRYRLFDHAGRAAT
jgi:hypothetical protein